MLRLQASHKVQIDNEHVKVTKWHFPPQGETGFHIHSMDYIVVPQTTGQLLMKTKLENFKTNLIACESYFRKSGTAHNVINNNDYEFIFIEIELKNKR